METTEQVGNQPQPAATTTIASPDAATTAELEKHSSFLGYRPGIEVTADEPVTSADTEVTEGDGDTAAAPAEAQTTTEEDDPNWLPNDQQKVFPDDVIAKYAKRYGAISRGEASKWNRSPFRGDTLPRGRESERFPPLRYHIPT